ncbi:MAG: polysaccharide (de)acetylase [Ferruginibacter sp.]|uniref:hypothetical protein n=1 Tax=Ferruginibacter sp. TaxID=1940288 RepID=UPI00265A6B7C|nr:hypothetical protein [Ferruginibacter sp.]MDB5275536.1 polysaccharide (de)acetylase [Ferruginibacter sp.]
MRIKKSIVRNLSNLPGWRTNQKIVVLESDDWGAIRMSSKEAYDRLFNLGIKPLNKDEERYLKNDSLASESDLTNLFEVLHSVKDGSGKPAVFTVVAVVANPDFGKIKDAANKEYFYEPFNVTLERYPQHANSFELWKQGIREKIFLPQFHGREHLNVHSWLKALQLNNPDTRSAFEEQVYGISPRDPINRISYQAAFDIIDVGEIEYQKTVITEGLDLFEQLFGYRSTFFVPTNGPFNNQLEKTLHEGGIKFIGTSKIQKEPMGNEKYKRNFRYIGQKNKFGQTYLTRNCFFEPSSHLKNDWVDSCMNEIKIAFNWNKPAVISSHRVNYTGFLNLTNREKGLRQLKTLLKSIINRWPDATFITSEELGFIISGK